MRTRRRKRKEDRENNRQTDFFIVDEQTENELFRPFRDGGNKTGAFISIIDNVDNSPEPADWIGTLDAEPKSIGCVSGLAKSLTFASRDSHPTANASERATNNAEEEKTHQNRFGWHFRHIHAVWDTKLFRRFDIFEDTFGWTQTFIRSPPGQYLNVWICEKRTSIKILSSHKNRKQKSFSDD